MERGKLPAHPSWGRWHTKGRAAGRPVAGLGQLGSWETPWSCEEAGGFCCSLCCDLSRDRSQITGTDLLLVWVLSG